MCGCRSCVGLRRMGTVGGEFSALSDNVLTRDLRREGGGGRRLERPSRIGRHGFQILGTDRQPGSGRTVEQGVQFGGPGTLISTGGGPGTTGVLDDEGGGPIRVREVEQADNPLLFPFLPPDPANHERPETAPQPETVTCWRNRSERNRVIGPTGHDRRPVTRTRRPFRHTVTHMLPA